MTVTNLNPGKPLSPILDLLCGAAAGTSARLVVAPLDVLKIRFQVQSELRLYHYATMSSALRAIVATEGVRALWKGNVPALLMVTPYAAVQLASFYQLQRAVRTLPARLSEPYESLLLGAAAGAAATVCTYPLDLLRTRLAAQPEPKVYRGIRHATGMIYQDGGMRGMYVGLQPTLIEIVPYVALHFALYEAGKKRMLDSTNGVHLAPWESMAVGAASGTTSKLVTLPLDNAKKLMQVQGQFGGGVCGKYKGLADVVRTMWKRDGMRGCFRGAAPSLVKAAPNSAITFAVYEAAKRFLTSR